MQKNVFIDIAKFTILALLVVVPFRIYIAQPFIVSGASMQPTFEENEYLVIDQLSYRFEKPQRGDVVIFRAPTDTSVFFIKRIVGLPGEVVEIKGGMVYAHERGDEEQVALAEPYRAWESQDPNESITVTLNEDEYYVLGDNRGVSSDSRSWGPLSEQLIVGRPLMRLFPFMHAGLFPGAYHFNEEYTLR